MGKVTDRIGVRGGADDDRLVDLHDWSLNGIRERAIGGRAHVHHLLVPGKEEEHKLAGLYCISKREYLAEFMIH